MKQEQTPYGDWEYRNMFKHFTEIEHIKCVEFRNYNPVFVINDRDNLRETISRIDTLVQENTLRSAGLQILILLDESYDNPFDDSVILLKVEDWFQSCIPNRFTDQSVIMNHISDRESAMEQRLNDYWDNQELCVEYSTHSHYGAIFGQYRYLGYDASVFLY